jgi:HlyD family secretion protein
MKKALRPLAVILVLILAGVGITKYVRSREAPKPKYQTVTVDRGAIASRVTATGTLSALVTVLVGTQVSGRIESIRVDYNSPVQKGQTIATIEPSLVKAAVEQARANYLAAQANVEKAEAQAVDADQKYARARALGAEKLVPVADIESAEVNTRVARAQISAAKAGVKQAMAALNQAQINLRYTTILSPIDGVVISRSVDVGQTVAASLQTPTLFTIAQDLTKMQVDTNVAEGDVGKVQPGMKVGFTVDAYPGQRFEGQVRQVRDAATTVQNVVTYDAVIDVDNAKRLLKPGMTATVTFTPAERHDVLRLPNAGLRYRPDAAASGAPAAPRPPALGPKVSARALQGNQRKIWVLRGFEAVPVDIEIGLTDGSVTEVLSGPLKEGDHVVTESLAESANPAPRRPF